MGDTPGIPPHILAQLAGLLAPLLGGSASSTPLGNQLSPAANNRPPAPGHQPGGSLMANLLTPGHVSARTNSVLPSISLYQSARLPQSSTPIPSTFPPAPSTTSHSTASQRPFAQGTAAHAQHLPDTRQANSQRLASAAATLPQRTTLAIRGARVPSTGSGISRRARGPAGHPPSLTPTGGVEQTMFNHMLSGVRHIRIRCKIYPQRAGEHIVYLRQKDSFNLALSESHLLHNLELPLTTSVRQLLSTLATTLMESPYAYQFDEDDHLLPHESMPLTLMRVSNRGRRRPSTQQIYLVDHPITSDDVTLQNLISDPVRFVFADISFEERHLVLFFGVQGDTLTALLPGGPGEEPRRHSCVGRRLWAKFPDDTRRSRPRPTEPEETSGGETDHDDGRAMSVDDHAIESDDDLPELPIIVPVRRSPDVVGTNAPITANLGRTETLTSLGTSLWSTQWTPPPLSTQFREPLDLGDIDQEVFELAVRGVFNPPSLVVRGTSTQDLSEKLLKLIGEAVDRNDFTQILSTNRHFIVSRPRPPGAPAQQQPTPLSIGAGVEKEVVYLAFQHFRSHEAQWFNQKAGGYSTIAVTTRYASADRLRKLSILGAITGLLLLYGIPPEPLSPALIQYFLHGSDLQSLHPRFLQEWIPDLHATISSWLAISADQDDLSQFAAHFATFHDLQIASLSGRDQTGHQAIAAEMLHRAVVGPEPSSHPELQAFLKGFHLNCKRSGFNLTKVITLIEGGSEALLNMVWTGQIKSFEDLTTHLRFVVPSAPVAAAVTAALSSIHNLPTFQGIFEKFLKGSGIPCPELFMDVKEHFSPLVDLGDIDEDSFRPRTFTWAATGGPSLDITGDGIQIILCGEGDLGYASSSLQRSMIMEGKLCFRTCAKEVRIPVPYLQKIGAAATDAESFQKAFDHWMLLEILNGIGGHSIL